MYSIRVTRVGVAEARRRLREILDRVHAGEVVEISRRQEVIAVIAPPPTQCPSGETFEAVVEAWRQAWNVEAWPDDDPFADVRDLSAGRPAPW